MKIKRGNKKNAFIIITIMILFVLVLLFYIINIMMGISGVLSGDDKNAIGVTDITKKSYGYPLISLLSYNQGVIKVDAGIYRYGDVDQNGKIDSDDVTALEVMIQTQTVGFSKGQIKLADIDEDGNVAEEDLKQLRQYVKAGGELEYSISSTLLEYCFSTTNDSSGCYWQDSSDFKISKGKDYYVFVKQSNNGRISDSMLFSKATINDNLIQ